MILGRADWCIAALYLDVPIRYLVWYIPDQLISPHFAYRSTGTSAHSIARRLNQVGFSHVNGAVE
jgi:hypothetical protein